MCGRIIIVIIRVCSFKVQSQSETAVWRRSGLQSQRLCWSQTLWFGNQCDGQRTSGRHLSWQPVKRTLQLLWTKVSNFYYTIVLLIVGAVWRHTRTYFDICFCTFRLTIQAKKVNASAYKPLLMMWRIVKSSPRKFWQSFISSHDRSLGFPLSVQTSVIDR